MDTKVDRLLPKTTPDSSPKPQISGGKTATLTQRVGESPRRPFHLCFAREWLADQVPNETTNDNVLAQFCNLRIQQVANCYIGILDETLLEQANCAVEFLEFALDNLVRYVCRLALYLRLVDFALRFDQVARDISAADVEGVRGGDMQRDVFYELSEIFVSRYEIGFAIHLHEHTDFTLQMDVGGDDSLLCRTGGFFRGARDAFGAQDRFSFLQIAAALDESTLAIHESGIGLFTESFDEFWIDFSCCVHRS